MAFLPYRRLEFKKFVQIATLPLMSKSQINLGFKLLEIQGNLEKITNSVINLPKHSCKLHLH